MRKININMSNMSMKNNPIIEEGKSFGDEFITSKGNIYSQGNVLYNRYKGNYHIHKSGHICAGSHNSMTLQPSRFLFELPKKTKTRDNLLQSLNTLRDNDGSTTNK